MEYKIVKATTINDLESKVNDLLYQGWRLVEGSMTKENGLFYKEVYRETNKKQLLKG